VLSGEPGVGKTAIVEVLAQRISEGDVPSFLADKRILALDLSLIVAGTKYRGQFEERLKTIMKELMENQNAIIFIDELHTLVGAGSAEGSLDAANILKPALSRGEIQCIGATAPAEFRKSIGEEIGRLERRFQAVGSPAQRVGRHQNPVRHQDRYEKFHAVGYTDEAITRPAAVFTSSRYIPDRYLPDKAIDLIDEAGARVKLRQTTLPADLADIQKRIKFIVHRMENAIANHEFEKARFYSDEERKERENMRQLREKYNLDDSSTGCVTKDDIEDVVAAGPASPYVHQGRDRCCCASKKNCTSAWSARKAISALPGLSAVRAPETSNVRPQPCSSAPRASANQWRALAGFLFGSERAWCVSICPSMEKHSAKLIGSLPDTRREEGGQLTERQRNPYSIILLDEIQKLIRTSTTSCSRCLKTAS
jgi:ATP-dependent Clp protease ATP-binding subunit ClpC